MHSTHKEEREILIDLIQGSGIDNFKHEYFVEMLKIVSKSPDGGFDGKIRFDDLKEVLCEGST